MSTLSNITRPPSAHVFRVGTDVIRCQNAACQLFRLPLGCHHDVPHGIQSLGKDLRSCLEALEMLLHHLPADTSELTCFDVCRQQGNCPDRDRIKSLRNSDELIAFCR